MAFITGVSRAEIAHHMLDKLVGTYTYACPIHFHPLELPIDSTQCIRFEQEDLIRHPYGTTIVEKRYPSLDLRMSPLEVCAEISITTHIHLHPKDREPFTITEILFVRLNTNGGRERFTLWRPRSQSAKTEPCVAALTNEDCKALGRLVLRGGAVEGKGANTRQKMSLELRRTDEDVISADDCSQPWDLFQICLYLGPGVETNIAGKKAGFEIRRSRSYDVSFTNGEHDWRSGRVELFSPADDATRAKWCGAPVESDER